MTAWEIAISFMPALAAFLMKARSAWVEADSFDSVGVGVGSALSVCAAKTAESEAAAASAEHPRSNLGRFIFMVTRSSPRMPCLLLGTTPPWGTLRDPFAFTAHLHNR